MQCPWIGRLSIVKMLTPPKLTHTFNAIPTKISSRIFVDIDKLLLKMYGKAQAMEQLKRS